MSEAVPELADDTQGVIPRKGDNKQRTKIGGGPDVRLGSGSAGRRKSVRIPKKHNRDDTESGVVVTKELGPSLKT